MLRSVPSDMRCGSFFASAWNRSPLGKMATEQYDALLAIKGSSGANGVTVGEISEQLQVKHHTTVSFSTDWKHES